MTQYEAGGLFPAKFEPIVDPSVASPYALMRGTVFHDGGVLTLLVVLLAVLVTIVMGGALGAPAAVGAAVLGAAASVGTGVSELRFDQNHRVSGRIPAFQGKPIVGEGLDRLVDISERFAFAKRKVDELPELLEWSEIAGTVEAIRWDAARHAAGLSATEAQWADVKHAPPGTPQEVLKDRLVRRREAEQKILMQYQRTADRLMNKAADAAAAATVAAELGYDLEVAVPSAAATGAVAELDRVIERLDALTDAWRALDASTDLRAAELQVEATDRDRAAGTTARRLAAELDAGTNTDTNTERADGAGSVG